MPEMLWFAHHSHANDDRREEGSRTGWLFPGLGCRYVGMGNDLFGRAGLPARLIALAEDVVGYQLIPVCLEGSGRKFVPARQEAQIIYILNCAYGAALGELGFRPCGVLGHSLGSWAAAWIAGVFDFVTGLDLVTHVEVLMEELTDHRGLTMGAIIGLDETAIQKELAAYPEVSIANLNSPAQFVIGGPESEIDIVLAGALRRGAKQAKRLPTGRAIHTPWMADVTQRLKQHLDLVDFADPQASFIGCDCAEELGTAAQIRDFLSNFLSRPVRWEASFRSLCRSVSSQFLEVGPGNLLTTLASFIDPSARVRSVSALLESSP